MQCMLKLQRISPEQELADLTVFSDCHQRYNRINAAFFTRLPAIINLASLLLRINRSKTNNFTLQFSIMKEFALLFRQPDYDYSDAIAQRS